MCVVLSLSTLSVKMVGNAGDGRSLSQLSGTTAFWGDFVYDMLQLSTGRVEER
jgi:hypothetical protein